MPHPHDPSQNWSAFLKPQLAPNRSNKHGRNSVEKLVEAPVEKVAVRRRISSQSVADEVPQQSVERECFPRSRILFKLARVDFKLFVEGQFQLSDARSSDEFLEGSPPGEPVSHEVHSRSTDDLFVTL